MAQDKTSVAMYNLGSIPSLRETNPETFGPSYETYRGNKGIPEYMQKFIGSADNVSKGSPMEWFGTPAKVANPKMMKAFARAIERPDMRQSMFKSNDSYAKPFQKFIRTIERSVGETGGSDEKMIEELGTAEDMVSMAERAYYKMHPEANDFTLDEIQRMYDRLVNEDMNRALQGLPSLAESRDLYDIDKVISIVK